MVSVNQKLNRWTDSVRNYLFASPVFNRESRKTWGIGDFRREIETCIQAPFGEVDARSRVAGLGAAYLALAPPARLEVLRLLVAEFGIDGTEVDACITAYQGADEGTRDRAAAALREAVKPRRMALLTRFTSLSDGVKFLVDMRSQLLGSDDPALKTLDADLKELFQLWFDPGFLDIQRITWNSSASLLEKLMDYEANHSIISWRDLKNRLDGDRRCYTLFHPRMPQEPLAILHVALCRGMAANVQELLDVTSPMADPEQVDTAVFYSVTSPQKGLLGISFGEFIIKQAVKELRAELPDLSTFVTLSPVPGFRAWLENHLEEQDFSRLPFAVASLGTALDSIARGERPEWHGEFANLLQRKCLEYLTTLHKGRPINPVTRFHLRNGACIQRINFMGDTSANGIASGAGMMVNYGYNLKHLESNLLRLHQGKLAVSNALLKAARQAGLEVAQLAGV